MSEYKEIIFNIQDGTITERPYTAEEIAEVEIATKKLAVEAAEMEKKAVLKKAAHQKLLDLGLTEEEIAAL